MCACVYVCVSCPKSKWKRVSIGRGSEYVSKLWLKLWTMKAVGFNLFIVLAVHLNCLVWEVMKGWLKANNKSFTTQVVLFDLQTTLNMQRSEFRAIRLPSRPSLNKVDIWLRLQLRELMQMSSVVLWELLLHPYSPELTLTWSRSLFVLTPMIDDNRPVPVFGWQEPKMS